MHKCESIGFHYNMAPTTTGYLFAEQFMWHNPGYLQVRPTHSALLHQWVLPDQQQLAWASNHTAIVSVLVQSALHGLQPTPHFEDVETKRRLNNIIHYSGLIDKVQQLKAKSATKAELCLVHTPEYVQYVQVGSSCNCR